MRLGLLICKKGDEYFVRNGDQMIGIGTAPEDVAGNRDAKIAMVEKGGKADGMAFDEWMLITTTETRSGRFHALSKPAKAPAAAAPEDPGDGLEDMTKAELVDLIESEPALMLTIETKQKKADLIAAIRAARGG